MTYLINQRHVKVNRKGRQSIPRRTRGTATNAAPAALRELAAPVGVVEGALGEPDPEDEPVEEVLLPVGVGLVGVEEAALLDPVTDTETLTLLEIDVLFETETETLMLADDELLS